MIDALNTHPAFCVSRQGMTSQLRNAGEKGSTIVESIVAASVLALALGGVCATNWKAINLARTNKQEIAATICLQERVEQLRHATWAAVTSGSAIQTMLNTPPAAATNIPGFAEEVMVTSFPTAAPVPIDVTASTPNGAVINTENNTLVTGGQGSMVKVDISVKWPNYFGTTHQRTVSTLISNREIVQSQ